METEWIYMKLNGLACIHGLFEIVAFLDLKKYICNQVNSAK